jgi:phospholipid-binding lipoprotein MlaA
MAEPPRCRRWTLRSPRLPMSHRPRWLVLAAAALLAACSTSPDPASLEWDPHEGVNRSAHEVNVAIDRTVWGPFARGYGEAVPQPVRTGISGFRAHWRLPHHVIQYALQGRLELALQSTGRFVLNTVVGLGGILDPATSAGLPYRSTNVDETLHIWGVPLGAYVELPVGGPGTERDWTGWALDFAADPLTFLLPPAALNTLFATGALSLAETRYQLDPTLNTILYESADSYTALRLSYLQAARARLQDGVDLELLEDIYEY